MEDNRTARHHCLLITIDGPAGVGKSTVAKRLAERLGILYLDSGALYRALAWKIQQKCLDPKDLSQIQALLACTMLQLIPGREGFCLVMDGQEVSEKAIRTIQISQLASFVAALQPVREWLLPVQREIGGEVGVVAEGRDMGTRVFPNADIKFFLEADLAVRANRRQRQLDQNEKMIHLQTVQQELAIRDERDRTRKVDPLLPAPEAIHIDTSHQSVEEVVAYMVKAIAEHP